MLNTIMLRPAQQTYRMTQMDDNMESRMNQMNILMQYNMDNRMDSHMNKFNRMDMSNMMNSRQMTTQHRKMDNQRMQINNMMNNRNSNQMMEMNNNMNQGRMQ